MGWTRLRGVTGKWTGKREEESRGKREEEGRRERIYQVLMGWTRLRGVYNPA